MFNIAYMLHPQIERNEGLARLAFFWLRKPKSFVDAKAIQ
jgi:hypothetical protein